MVRELDEVPRAGTAPACGRLDVDRDGAVVHAWDPASCALTLDWEPDPRVGLRCSGRGFYRILMAIASGVVDHWETRIPRREKGRFQ